MSEYIRTNCAVCGDLMTGISIAPLCHECLFRKSFLANSKNPLPMRHDDRVRAVNEWMDNPGLREMPIDQYLDLVAPRKK